MISLAQLQEIFPYARAKAAQFVDPLNATMAEFQITGPLRQSAFLAQIGHESAQFRYVAEIASGAAYEGRNDLGNTEPGDGMRFKGRGLIQITGRSNYKACGDALGYDLIAGPQFLESSILACRSAGWFWSSRGLNALADQSEFTAITKKINGGTNGLAERLALYQKALEVLDV